jgi:hypothetical protein
MSVIKRDKEKKDNHLAAAEMDEEGSYTMIDGVINNVPKPSLIERMAEYERRMAEHRKAENEVDGESGEPKKGCPARDAI